jgi:4-amino-4-deoxy-L-arabinose transferase-like glycosyltransferase
VESSRSLLPPGRTWIGAALVLAFFCVPLFVHLGRADLQGDEPIYAYAVDLIIETGDWLTPRSIPHENEPFLEKPPLKFWIVAASMRAGLLPHDDFGQRFWDAVFGAIAFLYVFGMGRRLAGSLCGLVAVFILFVHQPLLFEHGLRSQNMEAALFLSYCGGMFHALAWSSAGERKARRVHVFAVAAFFVLGFMTKFVAAIFFPGVLAVMFLAFPAWRRRLREDWKIWAAAIVLIILMTAPWFVYQSVQYGQRFWHVILGEHVYRRMTGFLDPGHLHPWHYYFSTLYQECVLNKTLLPVACGLIALLVATVRRRWDAGALILCWLIVPLSAISVGSSKLYHYAYPFLPPLALAAGYLPAIILRRESPAYRAVERWGSTASDMIARKRVPVLSSTATVLALLAFTVAAVTVTYGRFGLRVGDVVLLRNSSVFRPLVLGTILLILSNQGRFAGRLLLPLLVLATLPLENYRGTLDRLDDGRAPVRALAECVRREIQPGEPQGIYVHAADLGQWKYVYYFRRVGMEQPQERPVDVLIRKLFVPEEQQPVMVSDEDYRQLRATLAAPTGGALATVDAQRKRFADIPSVRLDDGLMLLLPGRYATCRGPAEPRR